MARLLSNDDVASVVTLEDCIAAVEGAFLDHATGRLAKSASLGVTAERGTFHVKAARADVFAAKINANFPANPASHGLPTIQGVIIVMDLQKGTPVGILDSTLITTFRTAAATAVAARYLARETSATLAVVGCGTLAPATVAAVRAVRRLRRIQLWDLNESARDRCSRELTHLTDLDIVAARSLDASVAGADIIITCTPATRPFLDIQHAPPGTFIAAMGADNPEKSEITPRLMAAALVVPDLTDQAASMGDLHHAIDAGLVTVDDVHGELGAVISGRVPARQADDQRFVFDSTGTALQDVVVAALALERAVERNIGYEWQPQVDARQSGQ